MLPGKQPFRAKCMGSLQMGSVASGIRVGSLVPDAFADWKLVTWILLWFQERWDGWLLLKFTGATLLESIFILTFNIPQQAAAPCVLCSLGLSSVFCDSVCLVFSTRAFMSISTQVAARTGMAALWDASLFRQSWNVTHLSSVLQGTQPYIRANEQICCWPFVCVVRFVLRCVAWRSVLELWQNALVICVYRWTLPV